MGINSYELHQLDSAILSLNKAIKLNPYHLLSLHFLGTSYGLIGKHDSAVYFFNKTLLISNNLSKTILNLSISYYNLKQYNLSLETFLKLDNINIIINKTTLFALLSKNGISNNYTSFSNNDLLVEIN